MSLRSVTYTSRAVSPFDDQAFHNLGIEAGRLNALDGITGLLVYNGSRFSQTIEGAPDALDDLIGRLRRDQRHADFLIVEDAPIANRRFRSWDMQVLTVPEECQAALEFAKRRLDSDLDVEARAKLYETVESAFA